MKKSLRQQYLAQVRRLEKLQERMLARGYSFDADIIPPEPKRITAGSIRRLKAITPKAVASKSYYQGPLAPEGGATGIKGYHLEAQAAARQGARTKRENTPEAKARKARQDARIKRDQEQRKHYRETYDERGLPRNKGGESKKRESSSERLERKREEFGLGLDKAMKADRARAEQERFERAQRARDRENRERMENDREFSTKFEQGRVTMERLEQTIRDTGRFNETAASEMRGMLDSAINKNGMRSVLINIGEHGEELIELAEDIAEYEVGSKSYNNILSAFATLIGHIPTAEETARWSEVSDVSEDGESYTV